MDATSVVAAVGAILGSAGGAKLIDGWLRRNRTIEVADSLRDELRDDVTALREHVHALEDEAAKWRQMFYDLQLKCTQLEIEVARLRAAASGSA